MCHDWQEEDGSFPKSASSPETSIRGKGLKTSERTGESRDEGPKTNGNEKTSGEQSWRLATRGRLMANGYVSRKLQPFQNLSRSLFHPRRFSPPGDSAAFNGTARQPSPVMGTWHAPPRIAALRAVVRCSQAPRWGQTKEMYYHYFWSVAKPCNSGIC
jgi:hypothetical protein